MFVTTNLRQGIDGDIEIMLLMIVQNMTCFKRLLMFDLKYIYTTFCFVISIAPTEEIRVMALELQSKFAVNDRELRLEST